MNKRKNVSETFLITAYFVAAGMGAIISGLLAAIVLLLFFTIRDLIYSLTHDLNNKD